MVSNSRNPNRFHYKTRLIADRHRAHRRYLLSNLASRFGRARLPCVRVVQLRLDREPGTDRHERSCARYSLAGIGSNHHDSIRTLSASDRLYQTKRIAHVARFDLPSTLHEGVRSWSRPYTRSSYRAL